MESFLFVRNCLQFYGCQNSNNEPQPTQKKTNHNQKLSKQHKNPTYKLQMFRQKRTSLEELVKQMDWTSFFGSPRHGLMTRITSTHSPQVVIILSLSDLINQHW